MNDWRIEMEHEYEDGDRPSQHRKKFNKEKFCRKNRTGKGEYGLHIYENDRCIFCKKIDPRIKHNYGENR